MKRLMGWLGERFLRHLKRSRIPLPESRRFTICASLKPHPLRHNDGKGAPVSKIRCYRIDHRQDLAAGEPITFFGDHKDRLDGPLGAAEDLLRAAPGAMGPMRETSLYAFESALRAEKYFIGKKGCLYELEADTGDVLHIADMALLNKIAAAADETDKAKYVEQYLAGDRGAWDHVELLLSRAVVVKRLYTAADKRMLMRKHYPTSGLGNSGSSNGSGTDQTS
jgi:hypothetical protein